MWVLITCTLVTTLYATTLTIANVALPQMQGSLSSTPDQIAWIVTFNIVATAVVTPIAGWLAMRFGLVASYVFFALVTWVGAGVSAMLPPARVRARGFDGTQGRLGRLLEKDET